MPGLGDEKLAWQRKKGGKEGKEGKDAGELGERSTRLSKCVYCSSGEGHVVQARIDMAAAMRDESHR